MNWVLSSIDGGPSDAAAATYSPRAPRHRRVRQQRLLGSRLPLRSSHPETSPPSRLRRSGVGRFPHERSTSDPPALPPRSPALSRAFVVCRMMGSGSLMGSGTRLMRGGIQYDAFGGIRYEVGVRTRRRRGALLAGGSGTRLVFGRDVDAVPWRSQGGLEASETCGEGRSGGGKGADFEGWTQVSLDSRLGGLRAGRGGGGGVRRLRGRRVRLRRAARCRPELGDPVRGWCSDARRRGALAARRAVSRRRKRAVRARRGGGKGADFEGWTQVSLDSRL